MDHHRPGDYQAALAEADPVAEASDIWVPVLLAALHGQPGSQDEAQRALDRAQALDASALQNPVAWLRLHNAREDLIDKVMDGLVKAGLKRTPRPVDGRGLGR